MNHHQHRVARLLHHRHQLKRYQQQPCSTTTRKWSILATSTTPNFHHHDRHNRHNQYSYHTLNTNTLLAINPISPSNDDKNSNNNIQSNAHTIKSHSYHTTTKREIIPLLAVGTVAVLGTYTYKALQQMDQDWEEYEEALKEYKLEHGLSDDDMDDLISTTTAKENGSSKVLFKQGKMSIDLGSTNIRIGYLSSNNNNNKKSNIKPKVVVNRQGGRSTPNSIIIETDGSIITGTMANAKIYERSKSNNPVLNPYQLLLHSKEEMEKNGNGGNSNDMITTTTYAVENSISTLAKDALEQVLGGGSNNNSKTGKLLFSMDDDNNNITGGYNTQPILTYPPPPSTTTNEYDNDSNTIKDLYSKVISGIVSPSSSDIVKLIPEPVSAVIGARHYNLLPSSTSSSLPSSVMVIDIGGKTTSISIINEEKQTIQFHTNIHNFGGETIIETLMNYLSKSFYKCQSIDDVSDTMGIQRLYDASKSAIMELGGSKHGRIQINIPYLSVDDKMQPRHLDVGLSVKVLEAELEDAIQNDIIPNIKGSGGGVFSQSMNDHPTNVQEMFSSMIMNVFEKSNINPFMLNSVLIIGGGARSSFYQNKIKGAFSNLAGEQFVQDKLIIPSGAKGEELVVMGALLADSGDKK